MARDPSRSPRPPPPPLALYQPERGYRFNADSIHLVQFADAGRPAEIVCDLGAGSGVIGLSLLALGAAQRGVFVEIDAEQAARCARNVSENALRGQVLAADVTHAPVAERCGLVVCNPPYFAPEEGRKPADAARITARFGGVEAFARAAARFCTPRGRVCFVYPARSSVRLLQALQGSGLEPKRLCWVHARTDAPARLVLVEARAGRPGGMLVEPPRIEQL